MRNIFRSLYSGNPDIPKPRKDLSQEKPAKLLFKYEVLNNPEQRRILYERVKELVEVVEKHKYKGLVFLDQSARPIAQLYRLVKHKIYPESRINPAVSFIQVGRETTWNVADWYIHNIDEDIEQETKESYKRYGIKVGDEEWPHLIRSQARGYAEDDVTDNPTRFLKAVGSEAIEDIRKQQLNLQKMAVGSRILIVDEFSISGTSLQAAKLLLEAAFPDLDFDIVAFSNERMPYAMSKDKYGMEPDPLFYIEDEGPGHYGAPWSTHGTSMVEGVVGVIEGPGFLSRSVEDGNAATRDKINHFREELKMLVDEEYQRGIDSRSSQEL